MEKSILAEARSILVSRGYGGFSVRKVAKAAGVSLGHLQHYFPNRAVLLREALDSLALNFMYHFEQDIAPMESALDRLSACAEFILDRGPDEDMIALLREFWCIARQDQAVADSLSGFYKACVSLAARVMQEANTSLSKEQAVKRARVAVSLLSGAFLFIEPWGREREDPEFRDHIVQIVTRLPFNAHEPT